MSRGVREHPHHLGLRFADGEAAYRIAVEPDADQFSQGLIAERLVHPALHDAEERVRIPFVCALRAPGPA